MMKDFNSGRCILYIYHLFCIKSDLDIYKMKNRVDQSKTQKYITAPEMPWHCPHQNLSYKRDNCKAFSCQSLTLPRLSRTNMCRASHHRCTAKKSAEVLCHGPCGSRSGREAREAVAPQPHLHLHELLFP